MEEKGNRNGNKEERMWPDEVRWHDFFFQIISYKNQGFWTDEQVSKEEKEALML